MKPYLVQCRIPDLGPAPGGAIAIYVAYVENEDAALAAVKAQAPSVWQIEEVVGIATDGIVARKRIQPGYVGELSRA